MQSLVDPKPLGAFIEYTLKPLIDYSHELIQVLDEKGLAPKDVLKASMKLYIFHSILNLVTTISVTGMICYTILRCLHTNL